MRVLTFLAFHLLICVVVTCGQVGVEPHSPVTTPTLAPIVQGGDEAAIRAQYGAQVELAPDSNLGDFSDSSQLANELASMSQFGASLGNCGASDLAGDAVCGPSAFPGCYGETGARGAFYVDHLYLRPRGAEYTFASSVLNNNFNTSMPLILDGEYEPAFRVGVDLYDQQSAVSASWTRYRSFERQTVNNPVQGGVVVPLTDRPLIYDAIFNQPIGRETASREVDFDLVDLIIRSPLRTCLGMQLETFAGARYGKLRVDQLSNVDFPTNSFREDYSSTTRSGFEGIGPMIGLTLMNELRPGLSVFHVADASYLFGDAGAQVDSPFFGFIRQPQDEVTILGYELGLAWCPIPGFDLRLGYSVRRWSDILLQTTSFSTTSSGMTFDGYTLRGRWKF